MEVFLSFGIVNIGKFCLFEMLMDYLLKIIHYPCHEWMADRKGVIVYHRNRKYMQ